MNTSRFQNTRLDGMKRNIRISNEFKLDVDDVVRSSLPSPPPLPPLPPPSSKPMSNKLDLTKCRDISKESNRLFSSSEDDDATDDSE